MNRAEWAIVLILRTLGTLALLALPFIFLPHAGMDAIHGWLGLGRLPDAPIVGYLARSASLLYAAYGTLVWYISLDIRRRRGFVVWWGAAFATAGCVLLWIDLSVGMPWHWTLAEGPPAIALGLGVLWLARWIQPAE